MTERGSCSRADPRVGKTDGRHGDQLGGGALGIGQVGLADLLGHRDHDPLVADHGADAQAKGHANDDPGWNVLDGLSELLSRPFELRANRACLRPTSAFRECGRAERSWSGPASDPRAAPREARPCRRVASISASMLMQSLGKRSSADDEASIELEALWPPSGHRERRRRP